MSFSYGSFAGGIAQGAEAGVGMADKLRQLNDAARIRAANGMRAHAYLSDVPLTDGSAPLPPPVTPPSPGQPSVPLSSDSTGFTAGQDQMNAPQPVDSSMAGAPSNDISGMGGGAPAPPSPLPPPLPQATPAPPNMAPTGAGPATGADGTPLSGTAASVGDPSGGQDQHAAITSSIQDANNTIRALARAFKQANPNASDEQVMEAVNQHIETMKGLRNEVKDYMKAQVELAKIQQKVLTTGMNIQGRQGVADTRAQATTTAAQTAADSRVTVGAGNNQARVASAQLSSDARTAAAQIAAQGGITRSQIAADTGRYVADANNKTRVYDTQLQQFVKIAAGNSADQAKVDAETARAGGTPPVRKRLNPLPMPAAPGGTYLDAQGNPVATGSSAPPSPKRAAGGYASQAAVTAAYRAGKIDRNTAAGILQNQFGVK